MTCAYCVVQYGDLNRDEHMNIAVLVWERELPLRGPEPVPSTPVLCAMLSDWSRVRAAFVRPDELVEDVIKRITAITTYGEYTRVRRTVGPYTPFQFTDERPSMTTPELTLADMVEFFLIEP